MGVVRDAVSKGLEFFREEIVPLRADLIKAGILTPDKNAYEQKANLADPTNYGAMNFGYKERWSLLDYRKSRQITYSDPIIAAILQVRINQVAAFARPQPDKYKLGYKIKMREAKKDASKQEEKRIAEMEQFIINTGTPESFEDTPERRRRDNFEHFLRKITRDTLSVDQINFEITPRRDGTPYCFTAVDPETIRLVPDIKEKEEYFGSPSAYGSKDFFDMIPNSGTAMTKKDFKPKHPSYVQVLNGIVKHTFDEWEMAFGVRNPRSDVLSHGYGLSEIEMLVTTITSHMNAEAYNRRVFTTSGTTKGILTIEGSVPPDQLEAFRRQFHMQTSGITNAWRTPIMALGEKSKLNWVSLHATNKEMEFGKWLDYCIKTICGAFQIDPLEIGFDISKQGSGEGGGASGGLGNGNQSERILYSQEKGLRPILRHIQQLINDYVVYRIDPNFEFEFVGLNAGSEDQELEQTLKKVKHFQTVNEIRAEHDLPPMPKLEKIDSLADIILDPGWVTAVAGQISAKQMQDQGLGPDGMPVGEEEMPEEGGEPGPTDDVEADLVGDEDLDSMSTEELEAELAKLESAGKQDLDQKVSKSLELEL
jgi:hypothetical protein